MVNVTVASLRRGRLTTSNESNKRQHVCFWPFLPVATNSNRYLSSETNRQGTLQAPPLCGAERVEKRGFRVPENGSLQTSDQPELSLCLIAPF